MTPRWRGTLARWGLVAAGCAIEALVQPPGPAPALVFLFDLPFLLLLWHGGGLHWKRWAWIYGFARFAVGLSWISEVHWSMAILAPAVLACGYLLWAALLRFFVKRGSPYPLAVGVTAVLEEMLQTVIMGSSGMPWPARPLAFAAWPTFVGAAAYLGAYGLSFCAAVTSAWASGLPSLFLRDGLRRDRALSLVRSGLGVAVLVGGAWFLGLMQVGEVEGRMSGPHPLAAKTAPLVIVQGNVEQKLKNDRKHEDSANTIFNAHVRLSEEAIATLADEGKRPLAILWPETMIPWPFVAPELAARFPEEWENQLVVLGRLRDAAGLEADGVTPREMRWLVGVSRYFLGETGHHEDLFAYDTTDSLYFVDSKEVPSPEKLPASMVAAPKWTAPWLVSVGRHDKAILVPWGEYTPGGSWIPFLKSIRGGISIIPEITPGSRDQEPFLLSIEPPVVPGLANRQVLAGTIICFEIAFPARCREWRSKGATVLLNAGNYAWYGDTGMPAQVLAMGKLRAAELAVTVVIAGNTGPSGIIDPSGAWKEHVLSNRRTQFVEGWCAGPLWSDPGYHTLYARFGDLPWWIATAGLLLHLWLRRRAVGRGTGAPAPGSAGALPLSESGPETNATDANSDS